LISVVWKTNSPTPADETKSFYWRNHGIAVIQIDDPRLSWEARETIKQYMTRQHGVCRKLEKST
jgi:hypothetical protein